MTISIDGLTLKYGDQTAISGLSLEVGQGEALVLLGQSGCGKTSTMRSIAGLETPTAGRITVGDNVVFDGAKHVNMAPHRRNIGMVFQSYAIWPHMTVFENVAFPLKMKRSDKGSIRGKVDETLRLVGLDHLSDRGASMLSGGQMQRVALARSLVMAPSVLLLDEPLSNLDARLRVRLRTELRELQTSLGLTSVYVTHDQDEALALADRIALMRSGRIVQIGRPAEIYAKPASAAIAEFLGVDNIIPVELGGAGQVTTKAGGERLPVMAHGASGELFACIRAEDIDVEPLIDSAGNGALTGSITLVEFQGPTIRYRLRTERGLVLDALASRKSNPGVQEGDRVSIRLAPEATHVLPNEAAA